ncbi:hypothetical protein I4U23_016739 [Adineta vaga]|nr:hypothetical protein I4U23_016739 [Adineta vaga]
MFDKKSSCIEDLANELWLEVFEYVDWINLFTSFYGINERINQLIQSIKSLSLYSSYLVERSNSTYILFQEFPIEKFKQIQHFRLEYDDPYDGSFNIVKHLPSVSILVSLTISGHWDNRTCVNPPTMNFFRLNCPFLQRLYLQGTLFNGELPLVNNLCTFYFPSLLYIEVGVLHYVLAIRILEQCPQLRSLSAKLYVYPNDDGAKVSSALSSTRINMGLPNMKKLNLRGDQDFYNPFLTKFLELLLRCCPNLHTFSFEFTWYQNDRSLLDPYWWTTMLGSHNKLKQISLQLNVYGVLKALSKDVVNKFELLPFFSQLNVNVTYTIERTEFPHMTHNYCIKN